MKIRITGIVRESIVDGPGLRTAVFAQGCSHHCLGCHNPQTWDFNAGQQIDVDRVMEEIKKVKLITGVTLSGGEPFDQAEGFAELAEKVKGQGLSVITFTGYTFEEILAQQAKAAWMSLLRNSDLLVDGPFKQELKDLSLAFRGSKNQRIIDVKKSIELEEVVLHTLV